MPWLAIQGGERVAAGDLRIGRAIDNQRAQAGMRMHHLRGQRPVIKTAELVGDEIRRRLGQAAQRVDVVRALGRHRQHWNDAQTQQRETDRDKSGAVGQLQHRAVAAAQSQRLQARRQPIHAAVEVGERDPHVLVHQCGARGM
nr:hypothetical protein [Xanthomonas arboricola]